MNQEKHSFMTKRALANALKETMKDKPFNKITISELIKICHVNRKTFYYHFNDIYHLLKWLFEQEAIDILHQFDLIAEYEEAITFMIHYIDENEAMLIGAYDSLGHTALKKIFYDDFYAVVTSIIEHGENVTHQRLELGYKDFLTHFYTDAIVSTWVDLIKNKEKRKEHQLTSYLAMTIKYSLVGVLAASSNTPLTNPNLKKPSE